MEKSKKKRHFSEDNQSNTFHLPKNQNMQICDLRPENKALENLRFSVRQTRCV